MPRAILDTNVLVSGLISPRGAPAALLSLLPSGAFELVVSTDLMEELEDVLTRPKFRSRLSAIQSEQYIAFLRRFGVIVDDATASSDVVCDDPEDQFLVDLYETSRADCIVSGDPHLQRLRSRVPVFTPAEFLRLITMDDDGH
jgi:uncharacterized protein